MDYSRRDFLKLGTAFAASVALGRFPSTVYASQRSELDEYLPDTSKVEKGSVGEMFPTILSGDHKVFPGIIASCRISGKSRQFLPHQLPVNVLGEIKPLNDLSQEEFLTLMDGEVQYSQKDPFELDHLAFFKSDYLVQKKIRKSSNARTGLPQILDGYFGFDAKILEGSTRLNDLIKGLDNRFGIDYSEFFKNNNPLKLPFYLDKSAEKLVGYSFEVPNENGEFDHKEPWLETISKEHWNVEALQNGNPDLAKQHLTRILTSSEDLKELFSNIRFGNSHYLHLLCDFDDNNFVVNGIHGGIITSINDFKYETQKGKLKIYPVGSGSSVLYNPYDSSYIGVGVADPSDTSVRKGGIGENASSASSNTGSKGDSPSSANDGASKGGSNDY